MEPPDETEATYQPDCHHWQIGLASQRLAERQHDEGHGQYTEHEQHDLDPIQASRGSSRLSIWHDHPPGLDGHVFSRVDFVSLALRQDEADRAILGIHLGRRIVIDFV